MLLIKKCSEIGLNESKRAVEQLLCRKNLEIEVSDEKVDEFIKKAYNLGTIVKKASNERKN